MTPPALEVHIVALDQPADSACLSPAELARADRFRFDADRRRFIAAHAALRHILAAQLDTPPANLAIAETPNGKPHLPDHPDLHFNLTHSAETAAVAICTTSPVGIDLEFPRPNLHIRELAGRFFSPTEHNAILANPDDTASTATFLRLWTAKEAILKCSGLGLRVAIDSIDVSPLASAPDPHPDATAIPIPIGTETYHVHSQSQPPDAWLATATREPTPPPVISTWTAHSA